MVGAQAVDYVSIITFSSILLLMHHGCVTTHLCARQVLRPPVQRKQHGGGVAVQGECLICDSACVRARVRA